MAFATISYPIRTGHEDEIADIFSAHNFRRARSPIIRGAGGVEIGRIVGTGLFIHGNRMARVIQYEGDVDDVARHMAAQVGVRRAERALAPYLSVPRDTTTAEGFLRYFRSSLMRCLAVRVFDDRPVAGLVALRDTIRPDRVHDLDAAIAAETVELLPGEPGGAPVRPLAVGAFAQGTTLVRMLQHTRDDDEPLRALADAAGLARERALAPYLLAHPPRDPAALLADLRRRSMRCISLLSLAGLLEGVAGAAGSPPIRP